MYADRGHTTLSPAQSLPYRCRAYSHLLHLNTLTENLLYSYQPSHLFIDAGFLLSITYLPTYMLTEVLHQYHLPNHMNIYVVFIYCHHLFINIIPLPPTGDIIYIYIYICVCECVCVIYTVITYLATLHHCRLPSHLRIDVGFILLSHT